VCTTLGRQTLPRLIESFINQLGDEDQFTIISDTNHDYVSNVLSNYNFRFKVNHIVNEGDCKGAYGHPLLNKHMNNLEGDFIMFADDDDRYTSDAFKVIKETIKRDLPEGFQRSEFLLEHGFLDFIVHRKELKQKMASVIVLFRQ
jgi:hypothetical protein